VTPCGGTLVTSVSFGLEFIHQQHNYRAATSLHTVTPVYLHFPVITTLALQPAAPCNKPAGSARYHNAVGERLMSAIKRINALIHPGAKDRRLIPCPNSYVLQLIQFLSIDWPCAINQVQPLLKFPARVHFWPYKAVTE